MSGGKPSELSRHPMPRYEEMNPCFPPNFILSPRMSSPPEMTRPASVPPPARGPTRKSRARTAGARALHGIAPRPPRPEAPCAGIRRSAAASAHVRTSSSVWDGSQLRRSKRSLSQISDPTALIVAVSGQSMRNSSRRGQRRAVGGRAGAAATSERATSLVVTSLTASRRPRRAGGARGAAPCGPRRAPAPRRRARRRRARARACQGASAPRRTAARWRDAQGAAHGRRAGGSARWNGLPGATRSAATLELCEGGRAHNLPKPFPNPMRLRRR